jgi:hypothetical protein
VSSAPYLEDSRNDGFIYKEQKYPITIDGDQPISDIVKVFSRRIEFQADALEILFESSVLDGDIHSPTWTVANLLSL